MESTTIGLIEIRMAVLSVHMQPGRERHGGNRLKSAIKTFDLRRVKMASLKEKKHKVRRASLPRPGRKGTLDDFLNSYRDPRWKGVQRSGRRIAAAVGEEGCPSGNGCSSRQAWLIHLIIDGESVLKASP